MSDDNTRGTPDERLDRLSEERRALYERLRAAASASADPSVSASARDAASPDAPSPDAPSPDAPSPNASSAADPPPTEPPPATEPPPTEPPSATEPPPDDSAAPGAEANPSGNPFADGASPFGNPFGNPFADPFGNPFGGGAHPFGNLFGGGAQPFANPFAAGAHPFAGGPFGAGGGFGVPDAWTRLAQAWSSAAGAAHAGAQAARSQASDGGAARASAQATGDRATDGATDAGAGVSGTGASGAGTSGAGPGTSGAGGARGGGDGGSEPILILKPSGRRPPLFLVAPMFGSAFQYHQLARCLDPDQPVYGLQSPVLHGGTAPETIPEIAASYVRTIRRRWPAGPYCVGGHSFGGWAAFEIARQLRAAGETVAFVGILGTCAPPALAAPLHAHALEQMAQWLRDHADLQRDTALGDAARVAWHQAASTPLQQAASANAAAALRYLPRPYEGDLSLFLTADLTSPFDHTLGWWLLATREIDVAVHSGNHLSTFTEPHVQDLARHLDAALRRAAAPTTAATRSPS